MIFLGIGSEVPYIGKELPYMGNSEITLHSKIYRHSLYYSSKYQYSITGGTKSVALLSPTIDVHLEPEYNNQFSLNQYFH